MSTHPFPDRFAPFYRLDENNVPWPCELMEWNEQFMDSERRKVGYDEIGQDADGAIAVSTVFVGIPCSGLNSWRAGVPLLFETKIFGGKRDGESWMHRSWADAAGWHKFICESITREVAGGS